ncbi:MAG: large subunit ribosomal protein [Candidatus Binatota bacterium]|nr:large subunit ribosomal protein [Candidatus Binatota bacterium]
MRHLKAGRKLNRTSSHRTALFRNLVTALIHHEKIRTTDAKAKELRRLADRMVTLGKQGTLHARRRAFDRIRDRKAVGKLFDEIAPRFRERAGGYTRIVKIGIRAGDAAPLSVIEWTGVSEAAAPKGKKKPPRRPAEHRHAAPPARKRAAAAG